MSTPLSPSASAFRSHRVCAGRRDGRGRAPVLPAAWGTTRAAARFRCGFRARLVTRSAFRAHKTITTDQVDTADDTTRANRVRTMSHRESSSHPRRRMPRVSSGPSHVK